MADKVEELALPSTVITRILKDAVPDGINISKEARSAVGRAASVFVLYATACASQVLVTTQRKTLNVNDVYTALEDMLYDDMIDPIKECLETFHAEKGKKEAAVTSPTKANSTPKPKRKRSQSTAAKDTEPSNALIDSTEIYTETIVEEEDSSLIEDSVL
ncbi:hypothetical protein JTE90_001399 [Oedothorax gibbosus]|uniref:DNA polymerase epsilon subunit 3 n=1 Tax=Oedothorax gibbosus TaxID=931172 RepID=A0AAV6VH43_9ARAC|nr:hypothetical protein JTE90_001399 [Oedothorax gibbosus]